MPIITPTTSFACAVSLRIGAMKIFKCNASSRLRSLRDAPSSLPRRSHSSQPNPPPPCTVRDRLRSFAVLRVHPNRFPRCTACAFARAREVVSHAFARVARAGRSRASLASASPFVRAPSKRSHVDGRDIERICLPAFPRLRACARSRPCPRASPRAVPKAHPRLVSRRRARRRNAKASDERDGVRDT